MKTKIKTANMIGLVRAVSGAFWNTYQYAVPVEHLMEDLLRPEYFGKCNCLKEGDRIEFGDESMTIAGMLVVRKLNPDEQTIEIGLVSGGEIDDPYLGPEQHGKISLEFRENHKWRAVGGGGVISDGHRCRDLALASLDKEAA